MEFPIGMLVGLMTGFLISTLIWGLAIVPVSTNEQFRQDCVKMAHGKVDKSAENICVKDGKILFHQ